MANFIRNSRDQGLFVSLDLNNQLIKGSLEQTIDDLVENYLDLTDLNNEFRNDQTGAPAYDPRDLLKVLFFDPSSEKSVQKYQDKINRIKNFLETNEKRIGSRGREVKSNITDNQSAKLKSSHGVIQGYNALAAVDGKHQIITSTKAVGTQNEGRYLKELIEASKKILPTRITKETTILADTGYFSEDNCQFLFSSGQKAVIPDNHFRQRDQRFHRPSGKKNINLRNTGMSRRAKQGQLNMDAVLYGA